MYIKPITFDNSLKCTIPENQHIGLENSNSLYTFLWVSFSAPRCVSFMPSVNFFLVFCFAGAKNHVLPKDF